MHIIGLRNAQVRNVYSMTILRVVLAIIFPPLAVVDKGCGSFMIVFVLTLLGWVPGVIAALVILNKNDGKQNSSYYQPNNSNYEM